MAASGWNPTAFTSAAIANAQLQTSLVQSGVVLSQNLNADSLYAVALANLLVGVPSTQALLSTSKTLGVGYAVGAGSSTTQITGKTTAFTCNTVTGQITFATGALAGSSTTSSAVWTNSAITSSTDIVVFQHIAGGTIGSYQINASCTSSSSAVVFLTNTSSQSLTETPTFNFAILRGAVA